MTITGQNVVVDFTYTKKDQVVNSSSGIFIDYNGKVSGSGSRITIRGGDDSDTATRSNYHLTSYYMTDAQRVSLTNLLRNLAKTTDVAVITSPNGSLQEVCYAIYRNFC